MKQTLIILSPGFPENEADTTCLPAQQLFVRSLNKQFPFLEIIVLTFQYPFTCLPYHWFNNQVIPFNGQNKGSVFRIRIWWRVWKSLRKLRAQHQIVGLLSFWCTECALVGKYFASRFGLRHYCWILGQDAKRSNKFVALIRPAPEALIAMSTFLANDFYKNHQVMPKHMIPNGVVTEMFDKTTAERDIDILGAGSLIPLKQYDLFIELIKKVCNRLPEIRVAICGKGPEEKRLKALIKEYGLEANISLLGEIPHQQVLQRMQRSKVFLHTSRYEGFSSVCLEALYAGAHVVSFCNPLTENVDHWYVVGNKEEMLNKIIAVLLNEHIEFEPVLAFSMDESAKSLMRLFQ